MDRTRILFPLVALSVVWTAACDRGSGDGGGGGPAGERPFFTEITGAIGLDESPEVWPDGRYQIPEISPGGIALFDYDDDGDLDIYQVCYPPPDQPDATAPNRLFSQQPDGTFVETARAAGLDEGGYGSGVAIGDVDNDGDLDVYVANLHEDALFRNHGDGTFVEVAAAAGIVGKQWSTNAAFFDYNRDGHLDLYVSHYVIDDLTRACRKSFKDPARVEVYVEPGPPSLHTGAPRPGTPHIKTLRAGEGFLTQS